MDIVDVCIISYAKTPDLQQVTERGIESLLASEDKIKFNVIVVESNQDVKYDYPNTTTLYTWKPFGYNSYLNFARNHGKAPFVFLANNDLVYEKNWASNIIVEMNNNPKLLSASPFCLQTQKPEHFWNSNVHLGYTVRKHLAGWAIFQRREIYDIIGDLEEAVDFWYSDNIYADQLMFHSVQHALVVNSVVHHHPHNLGVTGTTTLSPNEMQEFTNGQHSKYEQAAEKYQVTT